MRGDGVIHEVKKTFSKCKFVQRPDGSLLTPGSLPSPDTGRWVASRKADVVMAVEAGILTLEEACGRYRLTVEEFRGWQNAFRRFGARGLKVTTKAPASGTRSRPKEKTIEPEVIASRP